MILLQLQKVLYNKNNFRIMKTLKFLVLFIVFIGLTACTDDYEDFISPRLESMNMARPADSYNYPVYPGTSEWGKFQTGEEMRNACQVPVDLLKKMSTQAVIQAIWEYPLLLEILHREEYNLDFESISVYNNAYKELCERTDAGNAILQRSLLINPLESLGLSNILEILMSQQPLLSMLDEQAKKTLVEHTLKNDELRQRFGKKMYRATSWLLIARTMVNAGYIPFVEKVNRDEEMKSFIENRLYVYMDDGRGNYSIIPEIIIADAEIFIK
jgi:hypothetical protein